MQLDNSILIYPFNAEAMPLIRSKKFAASYKRVILCALKGSGFNGKDASEVDGGETVGIQVREDLIECLDECSTVLFIESQYIQSDDEDFKQIANQAALRGKTVINNRGGYQGTSRAYRVDNVQDAYGLFGNVTIRHQVRIQLRRLASKRRARRYYNSYHHCGGDGQKYKQTGVTNINNRGARTTRIQSELDRIQ
ncbi:MAG: hypothetical protein E6Z15_01125 [Paenibacillus macerans]|uniref:hypothetical protein n=1 Tax=Paenibacillus macerans TaxID=44252 RepID=UPI0024307474|nr:hypothetical protein [Paenibacillus macerans]MDU5945660.1 hypothetical protein [Paenibacillus macerans]